MKNPLWKRLPRELKSDFGKYIVIFLFMTLTIGFVSGFLVADDSMLAAYDEGFEKYNIEHGNFTLSSKASESDLKKIEKNGKVRICENFYRDEATDADLDGNEEETMRIYQERTDMNLVCLMSGGMPAAKNEIAIDRMYADNNKLKVGDKLKIAGEELTVTGLVALPDYSCLFSDNSDMMFDAVKFGVGIMTEKGADAFGITHLEYRYSWQYETAPKDDIEAKNMSEDFLEVLVKYGNVTGFIPAYSNQAITFTGEDMGGDKAMMEVLLYILIVIIAFVFAVTTNNTITKEASVIGTLRASGYSRRELLVHYISMPVIVTVVASVLGNVLGYTSFKNLCAGMYYGSYSLPTYETRWNADAFILTTVVPVVIMLGINLILISGKLRLSPLKFLRHDLSASKRKKAVRLPDFKFFNRFRLRIILQNKSSYLTLFIGIFFANVLLLFGMMMKPLLDHYQEEILKNMIAPYRYVLNVPEEPDEDEEEESYYIDEEEDESDYAESDSDIIDTNTPPINSDSTHKESLSASTKEPKTKKNCSEWLHEAIEKRNAEQHEQLEYPDLNLNYNKDGFYDDTPVVDTLHVDRFDYRLILKFLLIIVAMILIVLFFIWYAD